MQLPQTYVKNGLVLWLDGINKGSTADTWTDLISGHQYVANNGVIFGNSYVELDGSKSQFLSNSTFASPNATDGTIEIVLSDFTQGTNQVVYMPRYDYDSGDTVGGIAFGLYGSSYAIWSASRGTNMVAVQNGFSVISINLLNAIKDGNIANTGNTNNWSNATEYSYIGRRSGGTYFTGKIHAIRIYNRRLSVNEMTRNQKIDNKRFNLGLSI